MKLFNRKLIFTAFLAFMLMGKNSLTVCFSQEQKVDGPTSFEGSFNTKIFVESTRKDYFDTVYSYDSPIPKHEKKQYDKSFYGTDTNLNFVLRTDLSDVSFLDLEEDLYARSYNETDPVSLDYSSNKNNETDHNLKLTFGLAVGPYDYIQLSYINNIRDGGDFNSLNYKSNKGKALIMHDFNKNTCVAFTGGYEEREYDDDRSLSFKEGRFGLEVSTLISSKYDYIQIPNSSRGEKETFAKVPGAMNARHVIDYYTDYRKNPHDDDPTAKYIRRQARGELYVRGFGEVAQRDRVNLKNDCNEVTGGFETIYKVQDNMRLRLNEVYTKQDFKRESDANNLHDGASNYVGVTLDYDCTKNFSQSLTYSNEVSSYDKAKEEDNKADAVTYESFFCGKNMRTSFLVGAVFRKYDGPVEMVPDETERRVVFTYDYDIMELLTFKLKAEYSDLDYHDFEDDIFSNYKRKTWRIALNKGFNKSVSCELAYQNNTETHERFNQNDIEEKTVGFSLIGRF